MRYRVIAAAAGAAAIAGAAYTARWWLNYRRIMAEAAVMPGDIAGTIELTDHEWGILDDLEDRTCMEACCVDLDEIASYYETE